METRKVTVKQKPGDVARYFGLDKLSTPLAVYPSSYQSRFARTESDKRTFVTGLNPNSPRVLAISDVSKRKKKQDEILKLKEHLEKQLGVDLGPHSDYWIKFEVVLVERQQPEQIWNLALPEDYLKYIVAVENRWVAPTLDATYDERYQNCLLYIHDDSTDKSQRMMLEEIRDDVAGALSAIKNSKEKLFYVCHYLMLTVNRNMKREDLYMRLSEHRNRQKSLEEFQVLLEVLELSNEVLFSTYLVREGFKFKLFKKEMGQWTFMEKALGETQLEVINELRQPTQAALLELLRERVEK